MEGFTYLDNLFEPIAVVDKKFDIIYYNNYFVTFTRSSPRQIKKAPGVIGILNFTQYDFKKSLRDSLTKKEEFLSPEVGLSIAGEEESHTVVLKIIPISEERLMLCLNDVSVETRLHEKYRSQLVELRSSHEQLMQTDKLATIGQLTAGISHEINNPLTVALGGSQNIEFFLESKKVDLKEVKTSNQMILESLKKVVDIISNMKSFVHKSEDQKEYCDVSELILNGIKLVQNGWAKNNVEFNNIVPEEAKLCLVNKIELEQVIVNLLQNAVDALEEAGTKNPEITISLDTNIDENCLELFVKDNGPGIPKEIQKDIFKPFFTTKKVGKGTGLGMAISERLINKYRGTIEIEESNEKGTTFVVQLPLIEDSSISHNSRLVDNLSNDTVKTILVVDDEPQILNIMEKFIQEAGHLFIGSSGGEEALKLLGDVEVDIIISDYHMPRMNGSQFVAKVRKMDDEVPILFLSSSETLNEYEKDKDKLGISGLIIKPFTKEDIFSSIGYLLTDEEDDVTE
ncbi:MAG: signal transduction histidine kinase/ActR/RegA family two-component response regulator [Bacteriovoracaceae bacterium]|jgi:signal transduction histidine kinase/ActR/RegA family two-component response regulator